MIADLTMEDAMEPTRVRADNMSMPIPIVLATQHTDEEGTEERVISQHRTSGERRDDNFNVMHEPTNDHTNGRTHDDNGYMHTHE